MGNVDFAAVARGLKRVGFSGITTIEIEQEHQANTIDVKGQVEKSLSTGAACWKGNKKNHVLLHACSISLFDTCFSATDSISLHKYPRIVCTKLASYDPLTSLKPEPAGHCLAGTSRAWFGTRGVHTFPPFRRVLPLSGGS